MSDVNKTKKRYRSSRATLISKFCPIFVKKCDPRATLPSPAHSGDVGFDLYPLEEVRLEGGRVNRVRTGICLAESPDPAIVDKRVIAVPFIKIEGRSGLASTGTFPVGGIVDPTYRGEICVLLYSVEDRVIDSKKAIAQLVVYHTMSNVDSVHCVKFLEVEEKSETERGESGFGSTDKS